MTGKGKFLIGLVAAAGLAGAAAIPALASGLGGDWTQADHDASGNRANTTAIQITVANAATVTDLRALGAPTYPVDQFGRCAEGWTGEVIAGKKVYAIKTGRLAAVDLTTGNQIWQRDVDPDGLSRSIVRAVVGGRVFVAQLDCLSASDPNGTVRVYDAATGSPLWTFEQEGGVGGTGGINGIAVDGNLVLATGTSEGNGLTINVLDAATGALVWRRTGDACPVAPRIVDQQVYYQECGTGQPTELVAARLADGAVVWRKAGAFAVTRGDRPGLDSTHVFTDSVALDSATGATRYSMAGATRVDAVGTNRVFGACGTVVCAFDKATGARAWTSTIAPSVDHSDSPSGSDVNVRAAVAATLLYLPTGQVLNTGTGKVVTRLWTGQARSMSVGNGYVVAVLESSPRVMDVFGLPGT
jgi:outer membrane protein assembly factor BamB